MKVDKWSIGKHRRDTYTAPENASPCLWGIIIGHPEIEDGMEICTSPICNVIENSITTFSGHVYELGDVDPEYELKFPNAKERLLKTYEFKRNRLSNL